MARAGVESKDTYAMRKAAPQKIFRLEYRYEGAKPGISEKIIAMAANASGIRDTARVLGVSTDKVMGTLKNTRIDKPNKSELHNRTPKH